MGILKAPRDPDYGFCLEACKIGQNLAEVRVIGIFKLIFDQDAITRTNIRGDDV